MSRKILLVLSILLLIIFSVEIGYYLYIHKSKTSPEINQSKETTIPTPISNSIQNYASTFLSSYVPMQDMTIDMVVKIEEKLTQVISYSPFDFKYDFATNPDEKNLRYTLPTEFEKITSYYVQNGINKESIKPEDIKEGDLITHVTYFNPTLKPTDKGYIKKIEFIKIAKNQ